MAVIVVQIRFVRFRQAQRGRSRLSFAWAQGRFFQRQEPLISFHDLGCGEYGQVIFENNRFHGMNQFAKLHRADLTLIGSLVGDFHLLPALFIALPAGELFQLGQQLFLIIGLQER